MKKIKELIYEKESFGELKLLLIQLEKFIKEDNYNASIETSKAVIESICKTILKQLNINIQKNIKFPKLVKIVLNNSPFLKELEKEDKESTKKIIGSILTLSNSIANLRNNYNFISHGQGPSFKLSNKRISELCLQSTELIGSFLLDIHLNYTPPSYYNEVRYEDHEDFNRWFDEQNSNLKIGKYEFLPSKVLYTDIEFYKQELQSFKEKGDFVI